MEGRWKTSPAYGRPRNPGYTWRRLLDHADGATVSYFDEAIETATTDAIAAHQLQRVRGVIGRALDRSPFFQRKFRSVGLQSADEIRSLQDLRRLPFTK